MAKTKTELETEIAELKKQISAQEKTEQNDKAASEIRQLYNSYIGVGSTEQQAWEILITQIQGAAQPKRSLF